VIRDKPLRPSHGEVFGKKRFYIGSSGDGRVVQRVLFVDDETGDVVGTGVEVLCEDD